MKHNSVGAEMIAKRLGEVLEIELTEEEKITALIRAKHEKYDREKHFEYWKEKQRSDGK